MGSAEVASALVLLKGFKVTTVADPLGPDILWDWIQLSRAKMNITLLPTARTGISLLRVLRRKEMVALVVDVGIDQGGGVPVTVFGHETVFPDGPARLARLSGAPIVFAVAVRRPGGCYVAHVMPPLLSNREMEAEEDIRWLTRNIAAMFESFVRRYPDQWYVFRDMWPDDDSYPPAKGSP
jgi:KDO2-lipid IV(A) lauroyltransferase